MIIKTMRYPHGQTCASRRYFVFHTQIANATPSMIQMIVDVLIVVILKEMIYLPESHAEPSNCSEYRQQSDIPDPQP